MVGNLDPAAIGDLIRLCAQLDKLLNAAGADQPWEDQLSPDQPADGQAGEDDAAAAGIGGSDRSQQALVQAVIGKAVELLSGPGGLASSLRRGLGPRMSGPSLPLDIGYSETVPAHIRNAVRLRGRHCEWAGGCSQPAGACQVHHTTQGRRRRDQPDLLRAPVRLPPPGHDPPPRLDPGRQPRRDHHRLEQGQDQGPAQPRTTRPSRVAAPG